MKELNGFKTGAITTLPNRLQTMLNLIAQFFSQSAILPIFTPIGLVVKVYLPVLMGRV